MKKLNPFFLVAAACLTSLIAIPAAADPVTITKTSNQTTYGTSTTAYFTITISNPGPGPITVDGITDQLPTGFVYQSLDPISQVNAGNSMSVPFAGATGSINFTGGIFSGGHISYYIPAGTSLFLRYTAITPAYAAPNLLTTVRTYIGNSVVATATNTVSVAGTLPQSLIAFNAAWTPANFIKLAWTTTNETAGDYVEIEKNTGNGFILVGQRYSNGLPGQTLAHSYIDSFPATGKSSYRLKLTNLNGVIQYSPVVFVTRDQAGWSLDKISPRPFTSELTLQITSAKRQTVLLQLMDQLGNTVVNCNRDCPAGATIVFLDKLDALRPGIYVLKLVAGGKCLQQQLLKIQ